MILNEYNQILREHFDYTDRKTTKMIMAMNESDQQNQLLAALASSLYQKIVDKCDKIDFGSIPRSRGDITKVDGYANTVDCINIIRRLVVEYKEDPAIIDIELNAIDAVKALRPVFMKAFNNNSPFAMMYYNLIVASIQHSVSFLIAVAIQFVKDPDSKNINLALDKAAYKDAESNMILENLAKMNKSYNDGSLERLLRESITGIRESVEADEYSEEVADLTDDVTDEIEDAPVVEEIPTDTDSNAVDEDTLLLQIAGGEKYEAPQEEPGEEIDNDPFSDSQEDELSAGANNPDTIGDDEVEPTPVIPINGAGESKGTETIEEKKGSIVKGSYHRHPSANVGYGDSSVQEAINIDPAIKAKFKAAGDIAGKFIHGQMTDDKGEAISRKKWLWNQIPGNNAVKIAGLTIAGTILLIKVVLPAIRSLISYFWTFTADLSESLALQANLIEINALELEKNSNSGLTDEKKAKVIEKQMKVAQKLRGLSHAFAIKDKKAAKDAQKDIEEDKKKNRSTDMQKYLPKDIADNSDLF